jgi:hypothetical protein
LFICKSSRVGTPSLNPQALVRGLKPLGNIINVLLIVLQLVGFPGFTELGKVFYVQLFMVVISKVLVLPANPLQQQCPLAISFIVNSNCKKDKNQPNSNKQHCNNRRLLQNASVFAPAGAAGWSVAPCVTDRLVARPAGETTSRTLQQGHRWQGLYCGRVALQEAPPAPPVPPVPPA